MYIAEQFAAKGYGQYEPRKIAVVDDRMMKGVALANRLGMTAILVDPLPGSHDPLRIKTGRRFERMLYNGNGRKATDNQAVSD